MVGRFAPSPTGRMHLGNIFTAYHSYASTRHQDGRWLVRIEDLDPARSRKEYALQILDDLDWLGLSWDDEVVYQSERTAIYETHYQRLVSQNRIYPCYCTRADLLSASAPHESDGRIVYPGTCRKHLLTPPADRKPAMRIQVSDEIISFTDYFCGPQSVSLTQQVGDFIVRRSDGVYAYQLAVVVDDALQGVTEVMRGRDLLLSTAQQIYLYRLLGYPTPTFAHLPLLCNHDGQRLSKRDHGIDMESLRLRYKPSELRRYLDDLLITQTHLV